MTAPKRYRPSHSSHAGGTIYLSAKNTQRDRGIAALRVK